MMPQFKPDTMGLGLALSGIGVLLGINLLIANRPVDISPNLNAIAEMNTRGPKTVGTLKSPADQLQIAETTVRPLFSPTRREFIQAPKADKPDVLPSATIEPDPVLTRPVLKFQGTRQVGKIISALITIDGSDSSEWLGIGESVAGWKIEAIETDSLLIALRDEKVTYSLYPDEDNGNQ